MTFDAKMPAYLLESCTAVSVGTDLLVDNAANIPAVNSSLNKDCASQFCKNLENGTV